MIVLDSERRKVSVINKVIAGPGEASFNGLSLWRLCTSL